MINEICLRCWGHARCLCKGGMDDDGLTEPGERLHGEWVSTNWLLSQGQPGGRWTFILEELLAINAIAQLEHESSGAAPGLHSRSRKAIAVMRKEGWQTARLELEWVEVVFLLSTMHLPGGRAALGSLETKLMKYSGAGNQLRIRGPVEHTDHGGRGGGSLARLRRMVAAALGMIADALGAAARRVRQDAV